MSTSNLEAMVAAQQTLLTTLIDQIEAAGMPITDRICEILEHVAAESETRGTQFAEAYAKELRSLAEDLE